MKKLTFGWVLDDSGGGRDEYYRAEDVDRMHKAVANALYDPYDSLPPERRRMLADQLMGRGCQYCGHPIQITTPSGPCASCGKPWD